MKTTWIAALAGLTVVALAGSPYNKVPGIAIPTNVSQSAIIGAYYTGDGLGYNLYLELGSNGQFNCTWRGCLGVYGTATGAWHVATNKVVLAPEDERDMLKEHPLRTLDVLLYSNALIFVNADDNDFFLRHGPSRFSCFQRKEK